MGIKYTITLLFFAIINSNAQTEILNNVSNYMKNKFEYESLLFVSIDKQKMYKIQFGEIVKTYNISSSKYGIGSSEGSNKTPIGLHRVKEKYGANVPLYGRMIGRVFYGQIANIYEDTTSSKTDDITSRILWLNGLEEGINKGDGIDSYKRYIYIHGTSEEGKIGSPASHGCIRMKNKDVIDLFNEVAIGTFVLIL